MKTMVNMKLSNILGLLLALGIMQAPVAHSEQSRTAVPFPTKETPQPIDRGGLSKAMEALPLSVTLALSLPNLHEAEKLMRELHTPGNPQFHKFLSAEEFVDRFAPQANEVANVIKTLNRYGLSVEQTSPTTLKVTGSVETIERTFNVQLHLYEVAPQGITPGYTYYAPRSRPTIPGELSGAVVAVAGLDSRPNFSPNLHVAPSAIKKMPNTKASQPSSGYNYNAYGEWTVTDFAHYYNVSPLYAHGVNGKGQTLGILTLASFTPSDAFAYWKALGLIVNPNRLTIVDIDGGPGAPSDASGSMETTLDVEQAGGIAPGAQIIVYQAPNTNQGFVDLFATAIDANLAKTLSISWANWEWFNTLEMAPVIDPTTGKTVGVAQAVHELLVRAACQGQSVFSASGDGGSYEVNYGLKCFGPFSPLDTTSCSLTLSVQYPASDSAITATGGTTLPGTLLYCNSPECAGDGFPVSIPHERVWGWDYLTSYCSAVLELDPINCGIFPVGSGGGVSTLFARPSYQGYILNPEPSEPNQYFEGFPDGSYTAIVLPGDFQGRNVPDISFNADPNTGYSIYYTSDVDGFEILTGWGGTSFTSHQLNGITTLLSSYARGKRIGLLNYLLYDLVEQGRAYQGKYAPFNQIKYGDNLVLPRHPRL